MSRATAAWPRWAAVAALALVASFVGAGCGQPPGRTERPAEAPLPKTDPSRALAYVREGVAAVRTPANTEPRMLPVPSESAATAVAWLDDRTVAVAAGLEVWRCPVDAAKPSRLAVVDDDANDAVALLEARVDGRGLVAATARASGGDRLANARSWTIDATSGAVHEIGARELDAFAGRRPRGTSELASPLVSPTGRWELRVAGFETAVPGASERVVVRPVSAPANESTVATIRSLPANGARYTGIVDDAAWAGAADTVLFVAETGCDDVCAGALFAVGPDGAGLRRLADRVDEVPREWNGTAAAFSDAGTLVVVDVATGERVELGPGVGPKWKRRG